MNNDNTPSNILECKNTNNSKVQRLKIFDANSTSGYGYYSVTMDGVLHGCKESFSGTSQTETNDAVETIIADMKRKAAVYNNMSASSYEVMIYHALSILISKKKNTTIEHNVDVGCRPGKTRPMVADIVLTKGKYKMMIEVHGGNSRDGSVRLWHSKMRATDRYKQKNYTKMGFNAYYNVTIYDNPSACENGYTGMDARMYSVYTTEGGKKLRIRMLTKDALRREIIGIANALEIDKVMKLSNKNISIAVDTAWSAMFAYGTKQRMARYKLTGK